MSIHERFHAEVTDRGGDACLPRNLSDEWLGILASSLEKLLIEAEDHERVVLFAAEEEAHAIGLAAVLTILRAKNKGASSLEVGADELRRYINEYRIELAFEEVNRATDIKYEPASIGTIFTNRRVRTWRVPRAGG